MAQKNTLTPPGNLKNEAANNNSRANLTNRQKADLDFSGKI